VIRNNDSSTDRTRALLRSMEHAINDARARRTGQVGRPVSRPENGTSDPHAVRPTSPLPTRPAGPAMPPLPQATDGPPRLKAKPKRPSGPEHGLGDFGQRQAS
jgi:hypothetical protein